MHPAAHNLLHRTTVVKPMQKTTAQTH